MANDLYLNDRSIDDLARQVLTIDGQLAPPVGITPTVQLANSPGVLGSTNSVAPRRIVVQLDVRAASLTARDTLIDTLWRRLAGVMELRVSSAPNRAVLVTCIDVRVDLYTAAHANSNLGITLTFEASDPIRRNLQPNIYALTTARTACVLGTHASAPDVWLYGNATPIVNPVVITRAHTGAEVSRITLSGVTTARTTASLTANNALKIRRDGTIEYYVAGVLQTGTEHGLSWLASGSFPLLSPEDAAPDVGLWPTIELAATSGTPTGMALYYQGF